MLRPMAEPEQAEPEAVEASGEREIAPEGTASKPNEDPRKAEIPGGSSVKTQHATACKRAAIENFAVHDCGVTGRPMA